MILVFILLGILILILLLLSLILFSTLKIQIKDLQTANFPLKEKLQFERTEFHSNGQPTTVLGANYTEPFSPRDVMKLVCKKIYKCYNNLDL